MKQTYSIYSYYNGMEWNRSFSYSIRGYTRVMWIGVAFLHLKSSIANLPTTHACIRQFKNHFIHYQVSIFVLDHSQFRKYFMNAFFPWREKRQCHYQRFINWMRLLTERKIICIKWFHILSWKFSFIFQWVGNFSFNGLSSSFLYETKIFVLSC